MGKRMNKTYDYELNMIKKAFRVILVWVLSTMLTIVLEKWGIRIENLLLIYMVGVLISIVETSSLFWGVGTSIIFVLTFNFLFTSPKMTFAVEDPNYIISFIIFIIVAFIVSTLTVKLQKQMQIANTKTVITSKINTIGSGFLNLSGYQAIENYCQKSLYNLTCREVTVLLRKNEREEFSDSIAEWCYRHSMPCGHGEGQFGQNHCLYIPIKNTSKTYGVIIFDCREGDLQEDEKIYADTVIAQTTLVLERENLNQESEENRIQMERERLKSTLLRSISHDLRTPLTGIAGSSGFLYENLEELEVETAKSMLNDICVDSEWLSSMVENLLNMTRIQEGRLEINKKKEVVDDIISSAVELVSKRVGDHQLKTETPGDIVLFPVDGRLFIQVLVNLLDNAFRHSGEKTTVLICVKAEKKKIIFRVSDDGAGIPEDKLPYIFDNFFTTAYQNGDKQRGTGLGLTICKAIVEAQGGRIVAMNNKTKGATFEIEMPMEDN